MRKNGHKFPSRAVAQRVIDSITKALGETEVLRNETTGQTFVVPRLTWAKVLPLGDGTFFVSWGPRLAALAGQTIDIGGTPVTIPSSIGTLDINDVDVIEAEVIEAEVIEPK